MFADRGNLAVEVIVQDVDHSFRRHAIGQRGEAAQVGQPYRGVHGLGVTAPDLAAENPFAGAVADIGVQKARRHAAPVDDLHDARQRRDQPAQGRQLIIGETA